MEKVLILGIGNRFMMDDGIGIYLVEELAKRDVLSNKQYVIGESDVDYCLDQIERFDFVIILDAVCSGKTPGELSVYSLAHSYEYQPLDISPHNLHLFHMLYQQKDKIKGFLIGIEPEEIKFQMGLSQTLKDKWERTLEEVWKTMETLM
jgi:hydrogenase maturation protease